MHLKAFSRWEWLALALPALFSLRSFNSPGVLLGVDSIFGLDPWRMVQATHTAWAASLSSGQPSFLVNQLPFYVTWATFDSLLGLRGSEEAMFALLMLASSVSMWFAVRTLFPSDSRYVRLAAVLAGIFYATNPFADSYIWWHQTGQMVTWAFTPFVLALTFRCATAMEPLVPSCWLVVTFIVGGIGFTQLLLAILAPLTALYVAYGVALQPQATVRKGGTAAIAAWLLGLSWWVLPSIGSLSAYVSAARSQDAASPQYLLEFTSRFSSVYNSLRLMGQRQLHDSIAGERLVAWSGFADGAGDFFATFLVLFLLMALGVLFSTKRVKAAILLALMAFTGIALMKGDSPPSGFLNEMLLRLPFGSALQQPYSKLASWAVVSYCLAIPICCEALDRMQDRWWRYGVLASIVVLVFALGNPVYAGQLLPQQGAVTRSALAVVPKDYDQLRAVGESVLPWRVLQLPLQADGGTAFDWQFGAQPNLDPVIESYLPQSQILRIKTGLARQDALIAYLQYRIPDEIALSAADRLLSATGVGMVVLHRDWKSALINPPASVADYRSWLSGLVDGPEGSLYRIGPHAKPLSFGTHGGSEHGVVLIFKPTQAKDAQIILGFDHLRIQINPSGEDPRILKHGVLGVINPDTGTWRPGDDVPDLYDHWHTLYASIDASGVHLSLDGTTYLTADVGWRKHVDRLWIGSAVNAPRSTMYRGDIASVTTDGVLRFDPLHAPSPNIVEMTRQAGWLRQPSRRRIASGIPRVSLGAIDVFQPSCPVGRIFSTSNVMQVPLDTKPSDVFITLQNRFSCVNSPLAVVAGSMSGNPTFVASAMRGIRAGVDGYEISMDGRPGSTLLVLGDTFDEGWDLTDDRGRSLRAQHVVVNGFENGWIIEDVPAHVRLRYRPQAIVNLSVALGVAIFLIAVILGTIGLRSRRLPGPLGAT